MDTLGLGVGAGLGGAAITLATDAEASLVTGISIAFVVAAGAAITLAALSPRIEPGR
jgi:hypothetical protein